MIFFYNTVLSFDNWIGNWIALDQWQSEFEIVIKKDGTATTDYGSGDQGNWLIVDGNLLIKWSSGKEDYLFSGVMGYQRLSKDKMEVIPVDYQNHLTNFKYGFFK